MISLKKAKGILALLRPELPFAAGVCVVIGAIIAAAAVPAITTLLLGFMWGFFLSSPAMILNDYFDIEVDRINSPDRPLPSGLIKPSAAIILAIMTTLVGIVVSLLIGKMALLLYLFFWIVGFLYNWKLKEWGLIGNLLVCSSVAVTFILGGIAVGQPSNKTVWILSLMVFFFDLGAEIAADAMDIDGDKKRNVKSVAILLGKNNALKISALLFTVMIVISLAPVFLNLLGMTYLIIITLTDLVISFFLIKLLKSQTPETGRAAIRGMYLSGLVGMLVIFVSQLFI